MKKLLSLLFAIISMQAMAQTEGFIGRSNTDNTTVKGALTVDSAFRFPRTLGQPNGIPSWYKGTFNRKSGLAKYDSATGLLWIYNGSNWNSISGGGGGAATQYNVILTGNSIMEGFGAARGTAYTNGAPVTPWVTAGLGSGYSVVNTAVVGATLDMMITDIPTRVSAVVDPSKSNIVIGLEGANSYQLNGTGAGDDGLTYYQKVKQWGLAVKAINNVSHVFFLTSLPKDFHIETNVFRYVTNQLMLDSLDKYYGIHVIDMTPTPIGKFGENHNNLGSDWVSAVRSSSDFAYYTDKTHWTPRSAAIGGQVMADYVLHYTKGSVLPDRQHYMETLPTNGSYILWGPKIWAYDSLAGIISSVANFSRATSTQRIAKPSTKSGTAAKFEFIAESALVRIGYKSSNFDTANDYDAWDKHIHLNSTNNIDYTSGGVTVTAITSWVPGDKIGFEITDSQRTVIYKNDIPVYNDYSVTTTFPGVFAYSASVKTNIGIKNARLTRLQGSPSGEIVYGSGNDYTSVSNMKIMNGSFVLGPVVTNPSANSYSYFAGSGNSAVGLMYGFMVGFNNYSPGYEHLTFGEVDTIRGGNYNRIIGNTNIIGTGSNNTIIGRNCNITGSDNYALGCRTCTVSGGFSANSTGNANTSTGQASFSSGWVTTASNLAAFSRNLRTIASGYASTAGGTDDTASGENSEVGGYLSKASGYTSFAHGIGVTAPSYGEVAFGIFGPTRTPANALAFDASDVMISVSNGTSFGAQSRMLTGFKNGHFQFGTTTSPSDNGGLDFLLPVIYQTSSFSASAPVGSYVEWFDGTNRRFKKTTSAGVAYTGLNGRPQMLAADRTGMVSPPLGMEVYQTDGTEGVYIYKSSGWVFAY